LPDTDKTEALASTRGMSAGQSGRLLALDLGQRRIGVAISDELRLTVSPQTPLSRTNWKQLLLDVSAVLKSFDAKGLVIGLPLNMDGSEGFAAREARRLAANFEKSLRVPVYLQDERLTSREAEANLRAAKHTEQAIRGLLDSEAAGIILRDFIAREQHSNPPAENAPDDT
jgi:putative Holliday junction resolvase